MQKLRKGDRVRVMATVRHDPADMPNADRIYLDIDTTETFVSVKAGVIEFLHHKIEPGMAVECQIGSDRQVGQVLAVHGDFAWVCWEEDQFDTWSMAGLSIYEEGPEAQSDAA